MTVTEAEKYRKLLPTDRNPHWLQNGIVWDNSGTNWQLQFCVSFVFLFSVLFVRLHLKIANHDIKRHHCCHTVCSPNVTFRCSAVTLYFSDFKCLNSRVGKVHVSTHVHRLAQGCTLKRKQTKSNVRRYQSENQCPSWIVWLFSVWFGTALIFKTGQIWFENKISIFIMTALQQLISHWGQDQKVRSPKSHMRLLE